MIKELADFGKRIRTGHDALKDEPILIDLIINPDGSFDSFLVIEKIYRKAEAITAKKGKARLLLDKAEEVICYGGEKSYKKHKLFLNKLFMYKEMELLVPVFNFYNTNKKNGLDKALQEFELQVGEKERRGNIAFRIQDTRLHEQQIVYDAIIERFEKEQLQQLYGKEKNCSICGKSDFPVLDQPHGLINRVPDGQPAGCALVSYNEKAFESYNLLGNENSSICTNCAKNYVEGLNWLLTNESENNIEEISGKAKSQFVYSNRKNFGIDTAMIYWTKEEESIDELNLLNNPDPVQIANFIDSVFNVNLQGANCFNPNQFYSCTLSGAAARIAVRDYIEISIEDYRKNLAKWFQDIAIRANGETRYIPFFAFVKAGQNTKSSNDPTSSRIATHLWNAAIKNSAPPIWILTSVLKRIRYVDDTEDGRLKESITPARAALIRFILNRNKKSRDYPDIEQNGQNEKDSAFICGKIFAVMENIQKAANGKNLVGGIRKSIFTAASTNPAISFPQLMKLSQNHLAKLKHEKPGLELFYEKKLQELYDLLNDFPILFSIEEQGQFVLGYYYQKQQYFENAIINKELQPIIDSKEE